MDLTGHVSSSPSWETQGNYEEGILDEIKINFDERNGIDKWSRSFGTLEGISNQGYFLGWLGSFTYSISLSLKRIF